MMPRLLPRAFLWSIESLGAASQRESWLPVLLVPPTEAHGCAPEVSAPRLRLAVGLPESAMVWKCSRAHLPSGISIVLIWKRL